MSSGFPQSWKVWESQGKVMENNKNVRSHGKSKIFTPIRVQNIIKDMVVSKIVKNLQKSQQMKLLWKIANLP